MNPLFGTPPYESSAGNNSLPVDKSSWAWWGQYLRNSWRTSHLESYTPNVVYSNSKFTPEKMVVERQTNKPCLPFLLGPKVTFQRANCLNFGRESWKKIFPSNLPPFPARSSLHRSLDPCAWSWRQNRREGGGGQHWWRWHLGMASHLLKTFSRFPVGRFHFSLRIGEKTQVGQFESPNFQRILREKNGGDFTRYPLKSYLSVWCFGLPASNLLSNLCPRPLLFFGFPSSSKPSVTKTKFTPPQWNSFFFYVVVGNVYLTILRLWPCWDGKWKRAPSSKVFMWPPTIVDPEITAWIAWYSWMITFIQMYGRCCHVSNEKRATLVVFRVYVWDESLPSYIGIIITHHSKEPY